MKHCVASLRQLSSLFHAVLIALNFFVLLLLSAVAMWCIFAVLLFADKV